MHIAIIIPALHGGGAEFVTRRWVHELDAAGHRVTVYTYDRDQPAVELPHDVRVRCFTPSVRAARYCLLPAWLHRCIAEDKPDVALSLLTYSNVVLLLTRWVFRHAKLPVVISERNMPSFQAESVSNRERLTYRMARRIYSRADAVIAISHPVAGDLGSAFHVQPERLYVVPNPVLDREVGPVALTGSAPPALHVVFVGRLVEQKRPDLFLAVLKVLGQRGVTVRGTVIGDGPLREAVERQVAADGLSVSFTGWHEPWWDDVRDADCLLVTAKFEGLANVLIEAAAADIPSVASSRAAGVADAIVPGITGELATTDAPHDLADAVLKVSTRVRPSALGVTGWLAHFSTTRSTAALLVALEGARNSRRSSR